MVASRRARSAPARRTGSSPRAHASAARRCCRGRATGARRTDLPGEVAAALDQPAADHGERTRGSAVVVQLETAAGAPHDQPGVVLRRRREALPTAVTRWRRQPACLSGHGPGEAPGQPGEITDGDRGLGPRQQLLEQHRAMLPSKADGVNRICGERPNGLGPASDRCRRDPCGVEAVRHALRAARPRRAGPRRRPGHRGSRARCRRSPRRRGR